MKPPGLTRTVVKGFIVLCTVHFQRLFNMSSPSALNLSRALNPGLFGLPRFTHNSPKHATTSRLPATRISLVANRDNVLGHNHYVLQ